MGIVTVLKAGKYYCTEGGDIIFIQFVDKRLGIAQGFYVDGLVSGQWYMNGSFDKEKATTEDINNEVEKNEIINRYTSKCPECGLSRRPQSRQLYMVKKAEQNTVSPTLLSGRAT